MGFFKWTQWDTFDFPYNELDTSKGLRFSLVRYNRDNPIVFSLYGIPKDFEIPTREMADKLQPWLSQNFQLTDNSLSLSFRGCTSPVQSGRDAPITGIRVKFFNLPENQQAKLKRGESL